MILQLLELAFPDEITTSSKNKLCCLPGVFIGSYSCSNAKGLVRSSKHLAAAMTYEEARKIHIYFLMDPPQHQLSCS